VTAIKVLFYSNNRPGSLTSEKKTQCLNAAFARPVINIDYMPTLLKIFIYILKLSNQNVN
jgi:hypothetical protein